MKLCCLVLLSISSFFILSCGGSRGVDYDTAGVADYPEAATTPPVDPTYGAAAYEENTATAAAIDPALTLPAEPAATVATAATAKEHYVAPGDSLWKMSKQYGVSIQAIKAANNMTNDNVILGKKMIIPAP